MPWHGGNMGCYDSGQKPDTATKLVVLRSVDERINTAVCEHQYHCEVIEPTEPKHQILLNWLRVQEVYRTYLTDRNDGTARFVLQKTDEVIEPASEVDSVADEIEKEWDLVWRPADDVSATHKQRRDNGIASDCIYYWFASYSRLKHITWHCWHQRYY